MARVSNILVGLFNTAALILGVAAAGAGIYFQLHGGNNCQQSLSNPLMITGAVVALVAVLGLGGTCGKNNVVMCFYLTVMLFLVIGIAGFTAFVFLVTNHTAGVVASGRGFREYKTGDYKHWLENHFVDGKKWVRIRACLVEGGMCKNLGSKKESDFLKKSLTSIQSGCCKPPTDCGFNFQNATFWEIPASGPASNNLDCQTWGNDLNKLCYDCNSCRAGFLANMRNEWRHLLFFNICLIIVLIVVYVIGGCAYRSNRRDWHKHRGRGGYP